MNSEKPRSFDENFKRLLSQLLIELEEIATDPKNTSGIDIEVFERLKNGGKTPWNKELLTLTERIAHDLGIDPAQAEAIERELFF
ncbi:MAG TPA: hypothetical protein VJC12_02585 [Candidatus Paceibacterota bacterium]